MDTKNSVNLNGTYFESQFTDNETAMEMAERLTKKQEEFKEEIETLKTQEELDSAEKTIVDELNRFDDVLKTREYDLPSECVFEGKTYKRADIATDIVYFISKIEQTWQYVLGLYELCKLWKNQEMKKIRYGALDSTLRMLDQCKFSGMKEWRDILVINEFMKPMHEAYAKDTTYQIYISQLHNEVIKRRDLITPIKSEEQQ